MSRDFHLDDPDRFTLLEGVEVGIESRSGKAISVKIAGEWKWIPLSCVNSIHRDPRVKGQDSIEVSTWLVDREGLDR